jgi:hypothetical protein
VKFANRNVVITNAMARLCACLVSLVASSAAHAVLGGNVSSVGEDQTRLKGARHAAVALRVQVETHEITMADGSSIREYVGPGGTVFAVAWNTRLKPNLAALLGQHAATYAAAAQDAARVPGIRRQVVLARDDLVVRSAAHLNTFVGIAYLRSLVPEGINVYELR